MSQRHRWDQLPCGRGGAALLRRELPAMFRRRIVIIPAGATRAYVAAEWRDEIVVLQEGEIELLGREGSRCRLLAGDTVWLVGLPLRGIHNPGRDPAMLVAVARRRVTGG